MASDWQRFLATQMASYGVDPRLLQQPPAQAIPQRYIDPQQNPPPQMGRLGRGAQNIPPPMLAKKAPERPTQYQDPSDVKSQAIQEVRQTYEYAEAMSMGMSDQDAVLYVLREAIASQQPKDDGGGGIVGGITSAVGDFVDDPVGTIQEGVGSVAPYLGIPVTADKPEDVTTTVTWGVPDEGNPPPPVMMTPQEEEGMHKTATELDNWERILKPQYQAIYTEESLTTEIANIQAELDTLDQTYASSLVGEGGAQGIAGATDIDGAQSNLDDARAEKELELQQLLAVRAALYGPEEVDQPWYKDAIGFVMGLPGVGKALELYDKPSEFMRQNMGGWVIRMAANGQLQPGMVLSMGPLGIATQEMGLRLSPDEINAAYAQGGNAAVWEYAVGRYPELMGMNDLERALFLGGLDMGFDPLNAVGAVAGATAGTAIGKGAAAVDTAANLPGAAVISAAGKGSDLLKATPGVGKLFEPGQTAISRGIGNTAEDIAPRLEAGAPPDTGGIAGIADDAPSTPFGPDDPPRPFYADEKPFSDDDYIEYIQRTKAGEDPQVVIESIYARGEGGTPADVVPGDESVAAPTPTREDPLADLTGLDSPIGDAPSVPRIGDTTAPVPRPRYIDGTEFDDADFTRYQNLVTSGENADDIIRQISQERLSEGAPPTPGARPAPTPERPVTAESTPDVAPQPVVPESVADVGRTAEAPDASTRPAVERYPDNPEIRDIPVELRGANNPRLRDYGIPGWYQTAKGAWKQWDGLSRVKGVRFNMPGEKAWRQRIATIEEDIKAGVAIDAPSLPPGRLIDQETAVLINRAAVETDPKKLRDIMKVLDGPGRQSYTDDAGNRFVWRKGSGWQESGDGREIVDVVSMDGKTPAKIERLGDNSYVIIRDGVESRATVRSLGGIGDSARLPYVPEIIQRIKAANTAYTGKLEPYTPTSRKGPEPFKPKSGTVGISGFSRRQRDALEGLGEWSQKIRGVAPERIPGAKYVDPAVLAGDRLADRLARVGGIGQTELDWLNTPINVDDIRLENMTPNQRKAAIQTLGLEPGGGTGVKEVRTLLDSVKGTGGFDPPTRGEIYEQLLETMVDESAEARLELWKKILGGVKPALPGVRQAYRDSGTLAAGVAGTRKAWAEMGSMVRSSILYNWPRAIYNTIQDAGTNHFVYMVDGQGGVSDLHARMMKDYFNESKAGRGVRKLTGGMLSDESDEIRRFESATRQVESMYHALDIPVPAGVANLGGRFDEDLGRFIEEGATWWSNLGARSGSKTLEKAGGLISSPTVKAVRSQNDELMRRASSADFIMRNYNAQYEDFLNDIRASAAKHGYDADEAISRLQRYGNPVFGMPMFSPQNVNDVFKAYSPGQAEHLARRWRGKVNALNKGGMDNVNRMSFSFMPTRADEAIGKVWMFHYWMTRASIQHARLALENPALMANYVRTWAGMEKMKDNENLPAWARQYVSLMVGPFGMLGLVSPAAVLTGLSVVMDANGVLDDPSAANLLTQMPFHPIVQAAASVWLNERLPDPTGTNQTRQFAKAAINYLRNEMGVGDAGLTGDPLANLTYNLQGLAREIAPGAAPLAAPSPGQKDTQLVKYYAADIMRKTPDPENGGTLWQNPDGSITDYASQVMANIDAGLYSGEVEKEALTQFSTDTMAGRLAMTALPIQSLYPSVVGEARVQNKDAYAAENQPLELDTTASPIGQGVGTEQFIDPSRPATTMEKGGDLAVGMGDAGSPVSAQLVANLNQYANLGDEETVDTYKNVNNYIYMTGDQLRQQYGGLGVIINGERFAWEIWDALPEDARRTYMDAWMKTAGYYDDVTTYRSARDQFEADHPEVGEFKRWQETVGDQGGEAMLAQLNTPQFPAFQAWWATQDVKPADIQRVLMTPSAYLASIGHEPSLWDSNDISNKPTVDSSKASPLDVIAPKDTSNTGFSNDKPWDSLTPEEKVVRLDEKLAVYAADINLFNQQIAPYTGGKPYDALGPSGVAILNAIMDKQGITMPSVPSIVDDYFDWAYAQPSGSDTSSTAYVASLASDQTEIAA